MNSQKKKNFRSIVFYILILNIFILSPIFFINAQTEISINSQSEVLKFVELKLESLIKQVTDFRNKIIYFLIEKKITEIQLKITEFQEQIYLFTGERPSIHEEKLESEEATTTEQIATTTCENIGTTTIEISTTTEATTTEEETSVVYSGGGGGGSASTPQLDTTPPSAIVNFNALNPTFSSIDLSWTAPGDDNNFGTASSYDIRYSTSLISSQNWDLATQVNEEPNPVEAGSSQSMTISALSYGVTYYFAIKTSDEIPNISELSNIINLTTNIPEECPNPLASGVQTYFVRTQNQPQIMQVDIDPLDVRNGQIQTVTVKIRDTNDNPITSVTGLAETDNGSTSFSLSFISGTDINGTWEGTWTLEDTNCLNFMMKISAISASGQSSVELAFR